MAYKSERTEEDMDTEVVYGGSQGTNPSTHHTSFATAESVPPPRWTFSRRESPLLQYFCKKSLDHLVESNNVKLQYELGKLHVYIVKDGNTKYVENEFKYMNLQLNDLTEKVISIPNDVIVHRKKELQEYVDKNNQEPYPFCFLLLSEDSRTCTLFAKERNINHKQLRLKHQIDDWMTDVKRSVHISYPHPNMNTVANDTHLSSGRQSYADSVRTNPKPLPANGKGSTTLGSSQHRHMASTSISSPPMFSYHGLDVYTVHGSITKMETKVDGVVNAANDRLDHIGGVAFHIAEAAGQSMNEHCKDIMKMKKKIAVSENVVTTAGRMRCKGIIHAVGPKWGDYQDKYYCLDLLADTVEKALITAENELYSEVAIPAISAGIYGIPKHLCAAMYIKGITQFCRKRKQKTVSWLTSLYIVDISDDILQEIQKAHSKWNQDRKSIEPNELLKQESLARQGSSFSKSEKQPSRPASGIGGNVSTSSGKVSNPLYKQKWTQGPDETIPGLMDKMRCYKTDDRSFCVKIYTGSITKVRSLDAIVCTADISLSGRGPLSQAVSSAGGNTYKSSFSSQKQKFYQKVIPGQAFKCSAGNLGVQHVVHIVIDQLFDTKRPSLIDYKNFILNGLHSMNGWKMKSVALPLLAGGMFHHDKGNIRKMCDTLYEAVLDFCFKSGSGRSLREIHFVNQKPEITQAFVDCFNQNLSSIKKTPTGLAPSAGAGNSPKKPHREEFTSYSKSRHDAEPKTHQGQGEVGNRASVNQGRRHAQSMFVSKQKNKKTIDDQDFLSTYVRVPDFRENKTSVKNELCEEEEGNMLLKEKCKTQKPVISKSLHKNICASCNAKLELDNVSKLACGHSFCSIPCFIPLQSNPSCSICKEDEGAMAAESNEDATCVICMDTITDQKKLPCGHIFCVDCIMQSMAHKPACPICGRIFGELEGDQPENGTMTVKQEKYSSLRGYEGDGTIEIHYKFKDGIQKENHPNPGKPYKGTERRAFLPDNREGQKVLRLLRKAFDSRLTFTIGSSRTTGIEDVVTWNDIHHKTKRDGGAAKFGYPDPTYLTRVQDELAAKGIKE